MYVNYLFLVFKTTKPKQKLMCVYRVSVFNLPLSKRIPQDSPLDYSNIHGSFIEKIQITKGYLQI